jgi:hypothetical protein
MRVPNFRNYPIPLNFVWVCPFALPWLYSKARPGTASSSAQLLPINSAKTPANCYSQSTFQVHSKALRRKYRKTYEIEVCMSGFSWILAHWDLAEFNLPFCFLRFGASFILRWSSLWNQKRVTQATDTRYQFFSTPGNNKITRVSMNIASDFTAFRITKYSKLWSLQCTVPVSHFARSSTFSRIAPAFNSK